VWSRIPVVAMTAEAMQGEKERHLAIGMQGYVVKPVRKTLLHAELNRVLNLPS
jgi:CheY-like chemotaxis protein